MITLDSLEKKYVKKIKRNFKSEIEKYINNSDVQIFLRKAVQSKLTDKDRKELFKIGSFNSKQYPKLNWLCTIYIHPLTIGEGVLIKLENLNKKIKI